MNKPFSVRPDVKVVDIPDQPMPHDLREALTFMSGLKNFLEQAQRYPWMLAQIPGLDFNPITRVLTIHGDLHLKIDGTLYVDARRHVRVDSGKTTEPGRHYQTSIFLNSEFDGPGVDAEPVLPKFTPYAARSTTVGVRALMGKKRRPAKGGCGHGRSGCGCH